MKPALIVNPQSSGGKTGRAWKEISEIVARKLGDCEVLMTKHAGHGRALANDAAKAGHPLIIGVGGDGTISEIVDGVVTSGKAAEVGIIGQGTGGDFRRTLGIEHRLDAYLERLTRPARALDVGHATFTGHDGTQGSRHFINVLSCGMGGLVDTYVQSASRALGGTLAYFGASLRALVNIERGILKCTYAQSDKEESVSVETFVLAVCNGQYFGAGMQVAPMADPSDGVFEVVALRSTSKADFALRSSKIYSGKHMNDAKHFRADRVTIELTNPSARDSFLVDLDGEPVGKLTLVVTMKPGAVRIRY
jgi:diacylglycerol kinase (ATP)